MNLFGFTKKLSVVIIFWFHHEPIKMLARISSGSQNSFCVWSRDPKFRCKKDLVFPQPVNGHYSQPTATIQDRGTPSSPHHSPWTNESLFFLLPMCVHITAESWKQGVLLSCWHVCRPWVQVTEGVCNSSQDPHLQMLSQRWILASSHSSSQLAPGLHQSVRRTLLGGLVAVGFVLPSARGSGVWQEPTLRAGP